MAALTAAALIGYLSTMGLERADKFASCIGAVIGLLALGMPYLLPPAGSDRHPAPQTQRRQKPATAPPEPTNPETVPTGPPYGPTIQSQGARGVQVNLASGNTQHNTFADTAPS